MKSGLVFAFTTFALFVILGFSFVSASDNDSSNHSLNNSFNYSLNHSLQHPPVPFLKNWSTICSRINTSVSQKIFMYNDGKVKRIRAYRNVENSTLFLINALKSKGADTTQSEADYQILLQKDTQFNVDYSAFITKLESLKAFTCGNSSGQYVEILNESKTFLPIIRNDSLQVREAVMKIRLDLNQERKDLLIKKLGERENRTNASYQKKISKVENRTAIIENRTAKVENKISKLNNTNRS